MGNILIHKLELNIPEGFYEMDEEELSRMNFLSNGPCACLSDPERHMLITFGLKQTGRIVSALLSIKDIGRNMGKYFSRWMKPYDYRQGDFLERRIAGLPSFGLSYYYEVQDAGMYGESYAVKAGKDIYYLNLYTREASKEDSIALWDQILSSARMKEN